MTRRFKVVVTDLITEPLDPERHVLDSIADLTALDGYGEQDLVGHVENADALIVYHNLAVGAATISRLENCSIIVRGGVGYDNIDRQAATSKNIIVANVPDYGSEEVADSAMGMALNLARGSHYLNSRLQRGQDEWDYHLGGPRHRLRGRVFGIVGLGRIGTATAVRAKAHGFDVVFYDPYKPDGADKALGIGRAWTFDQLLKQSHILSMHCPLTDETFHMVTAKQIEQLPHGAILINTARGSVIKTADIPPAIESEQLFGAGIDVLEAEPPTRDDALVNAWRNVNHQAHHRVMINPHAAFYCQEGLVELRQKAARAVLDVLQGRPPRNPVNHL